MYAFMGACAAAVDRFPKYIGVEWADFGPSF